MGTGLTRSEELARDHRVRDRDPLAGLFASLSMDDRRAVVNAWTSSWHEGWVPGREDVENLTDLASGASTSRSTTDAHASAATRHRETVIAT